MTRVGWWLTLVLLLPLPATARPLYFDNFTARFGFSTGDDLYACGVCHRLWTGTGARNPFGMAVEQQLYLGKTILDAIDAVLPVDTDGDGYTNGDEITVHRTLPGYSCSTFTLATDPPANFQSLITPGVPSCLEPKDVRVDPTEAGIVTEVGRTGAKSFAVINNGAEFPLTLTGYSLVSGSAADLSVSGPTLPAVIPVGEQVTITVTLAPTFGGYHLGTLRIATDDPDEPAIDLPLTGLGYVRVLAPANERHACLKVVSRETERFSALHASEWSRCYVSELAGVACAVGARNQRLARAEARLRAKLGGARDVACAGKNITPSRLGMPDTCGVGCETITLATMSDVAACLVCQQGQATNGILAGVIGAAPPDLPSNRPGGAGRKCTEQLVRSLLKATKLSQQALGACELANVTASPPAICTETVAETIAAQEAAVDARVTACGAPSDLLACPFLPKADPGCLGNAATTAARRLVDAVFAQE